MKYLREFTSATVGGIPLHPFMVGGLAAVLLALAVLVKRSGAGAASVRVTRGLFWTALPAGVFHVGGYLSLYAFPGRWFEEWFFRLASLQWWLWKDLGLRLVWVDTVFFGTILAEILGGGGLLAIWAVARLLRRWAPRWDVGPIPVVLSGAVTIGGGLLAGWGFLRAHDSILFARFASADPCTIRYVGEYGDIALSTAPPPGVSESETRHVPVSRGEMRRLLVRIRDVGFFRGPRYWEYPYYWTRHGRDIRLVVEGGGHAYERFLYSYDRHPPFDQAEEAVLDLYFSRHDEQAWMRSRIDFWRAKIDRGTDRELVAADRAFHGYVHGYDAYLPPEDPERGTVPRAGGNEESRKWMKVWWETIGPSIRWNPKIHRFEVPGTPAPWWGPRE